MAWQLNGDWLERIPVLQKMSPQFLVRVALNMSMAVYAPKEKPPAQRLYLIIKGFCTYDGLTLKQGEHWGQRDMAKTKNPLCATAITYLHVNYVATQTIFELANNYGDESILWQIKKWTLFQKFREHAFAKLKLNRRRTEWRKANGEGKPLPPELEEKTLNNNNVSLENRVVKLSHDVDHIRQTLEALCKHMGAPLITNAGSSAPRSRRTSREAMAQEPTSPGAASHCASSATPPPPVRPVLPAAARPVLLGPSAIGAMRPLPLPLPPVPKAARPGPPG